MMERSIFRVLVSISIGIFAGISLTTGVYPFVIAQFFEITSFEIMVGLRSFIIPMAVLWALGGGWLGWSGGALTGATTLGLCGAVTGFTLSAFAAGGAWPLIMVGVLTGLLYGAVGGLIVGQVFVRANNEDAVDSKREKASAQ